MITLRESINKKIYQYDQAIAQTTSEKVGIKLLREKKRWLCQNDLFYLACLTGNTKIQQWESFYRPFCEEVSLLTWRVIDLGLQERPEELLKIEEVTDNVEEDLGFYKRLFLCYRTFYKTTMVTKLHSLYYLIFRIYTLFFVTTSRKTHQTTL